MSRDTQSILEVPATYMEQRISTRYVHVGTYIWDNFLRVHVSCLLSPEVDKKKACQPHEPLSLWMDGSDAVLSIRRMYMPCSLWLYRERRQKNDLNASIRQMTWFSQLCLLKDLWQRSRGREPKGSLQIPSGQKFYSDLYDPHFSDEMVCF